MKILLVTRAFPLEKERQSFFKEKYNGVEVSPRTAGAFGWFWEKALKQIGHEVKPFIFYRRHSLSERGVERFIRRVKNRPPLRGFLQGRMNRAFRDVAKSYRPDLVLVDAGELVTPETLQAIKRWGRPIMALWLLDHPYDQGWALVVQSMPVYDMVFTYDPGYIADFKSMGAARVECLPCACDADIHKTHRLSDREVSELGADLCFVGAITESRREFLLHFVDYDFAIFGWNERAIAHEPRLMAKYRGVTFGEGLARAYNASRIVLNIHHPQTRGGLNMRTFEAAGCGAFQLVDERADLGRHFTHGSEIVSYKNMEELLRLVRFYLDHPGERMEIALRAQARAHAYHTYPHRMRTLLDAVKNV